VTGWDGSKHKSGFYKKEAVKHSIDISRHHIHPDRRGSLATTETGHTAAQDHVVGVEVHQVHQPKAGPYHQVGNSQDAVMVAPLAHTCCVVGHDLASSWIPDQGSKYDETVKKVGNLDP